MAMKIERILVYLGSALLFLHFLFDGQVAEVVGKAGLFFMGCGILPLIASGLSSRENDML